MGSIFFKSRVAAAVAPEVVVTPICHRPTTLSSVIEADLVAAGLRPSTGKIDAAPAPPAHLPSHTTPDPR